MNRAFSVDVAARVGPLSIQVALESDRGPVALVGPNGSGKTSLLKLILGVLRPESGFIALDGEVLFDASAGVDVPIEDRRLGYLPQGFALFPHLSAVENVEFGLHDDQTLGSARARRERALSLLSEFEVAELATRKPALLSGGERQRVALARALGRNPRALLLDEPLAALDAGARQRIRGFLADHLRALDLPTLIVTHDLGDAEALASKIAVIEAGKLVQLGSLDELRARPASPFVEEFQGAPPHGLRPPR